MGFSTDYTENNSYELIPEGEYEVIIRNAEERNANSGSLFLSLSLVIRNDVQQACQNRYVFENIFKKKEPTQADMQVQGYSFKRLMQIAQAATLPSGKAYETVQDLCKDLIHKVVKITLYHRDYDGKTNERVKYFNASSFPQCHHTFNSAQINNYEAPANKPEPAFAASAASQIGSLDDFEEIISDGKVPF